MRVSLIKKLTFAIACSGVWGLALASPPDNFAVNTPNAPVATASHAVTLPAALRAVFYQALAKDAGAAYRVNANGCAVLPESGLKACFDNSGAHFKGAGSPLALHLVAFGRGADLVPVDPVRPAIEGNRVRYAHGAFSEWWRVLPVGFEQGFTLAKRPGGHGELALTLAANGKARQDKDTLAWGKLRYGGLVVTDASGQVIPATLTTKGDRIRIAVNDAHAVYPLTVDPMVWLEQKVTASDGVGGDGLGYSVAISGTTALIGAPDATVNGHTFQGAAYVFTESGGNWTQSAKLVANDGAEGDEFGNGVALDGTAALIGAPLVAVNGNAAQGAAYVFTESDGIWTQSAKLTANEIINNNQFGTSVALDGTTALIGAIQLFSGSGAAYVFSSSGDAWTQTAILSASGSGTFGDAVALDGTTALVGAQQTYVNGHLDQGAAYVFSESDGAWAQAAELTANDGATFDSFGSSVALDDSTALIGAPGATVNGSQEGAAYIFAAAGGSWNQTQKLIASDGASLDGFGSSVALGASTAIIGASQYYSENGTGKAYIFTESDDDWSQEAELLPSDGAAGDEFGRFVALDGISALVGAPNATVNGNSFQGAAYFYDYLHVQKVVDDFESGNPNDWGWANNGGLNGTINPTGGNPGAWFDSGSGYYSDHPNLSSTPPPDSTLRTALASGKLTSARYDFERLDPGSCFPQYDSPSTFSLMLTDTHTDPGVLIEAHTTDGPASPTGPSSWQTVPFNIPNGATDVPPGWVLNAPPELNYTWQELMHNLDGIRFFSINPDDLTYDSCWHLGADNVTVAYRDGYVVTPRAGAHGSIDPDTMQSVEYGNSVSFTLTPDIGYHIDNVGGTCGGNLSGNTYTTNPVTADCTVEADFAVDAGICPDDYSSYPGTLAPGGRAHSPIYRAPAGQENAILTGPSGFRLYALFQNAKGRKRYRIPGNEVHHRAPAGAYAWAVKVGDTGGDYMLCVKHP